MFYFDKYRIPRIEKMMASEKFNTLLNKIEYLERDRIYCSHDLNHLLDVARMMYIINLEQDLGLDKEIVYAAALTHDLGRVEEYSGGRDHHIASCDIAKDLMEDAGFYQEEIKLVIDAISNHRSTSDDSKENSLVALLKFVDKKSRACYRCSARNSCKWSDEKKNSSIFV